MVVLANGTKVLQYLSHDDYVETAKAFAQEVHAEREALDLNRQDTTSAFDYVKEDEDAINRQSKWTKGRYVSP
jgi:Ran-binding protein 9/10